MNQNILAVIKTVHDNMKHIQELITLADILDDADSHISNMAEYEGTNPKRYLQELEVIGTTVNAHYDYKYQLETCNNPEMHIDKVFVSPLIPNTRSTGCDGITGEELDKLCNVFNPPSTESPKNSIQECVFNKMVTCECSGTCKMEDISNTTTPKNELPCPHKDEHITDFKQQIDDHESGKHLKRRLPIWEEQSHSRK